MINRKAILGTIFAVSILSGCKSSEEKAADAALLANCKLKIATNYEEIVAVSPSQNHIPSLQRAYKYWKGSSLLPLGSRESAVEEASLNVCKNGHSNVFVIKDSQVDYSPQQKLIGGVYHDYFLMPYTYIELSEASLASQLDEWIGFSSEKFAEKHRDNLFALAKAHKEYRTVTSVIEKHIKDAKEFSDTLYSNTYGQKYAHNKYLNVYTNLVDIYVSHNDGATSTLVNWIKYHPTSTIKYVSYKELIESGESQIVEELLTIEQNQKLKREVGKLLI